MKILQVTTVAITHEAFLLPFAQAVRERGGVIDGIAAGLRDSALAKTTYDEVFDIQWSRSPFNVRALISSARTIRQVVEAGCYDIIHVHTPIAAFITRMALSRSRENRPCVIYTAHGFHFHSGGGIATNAVFRTIEGIAAYRTDYLVVINREDEEAARRFRGLKPDSIRFIPGIGVDTQRYSPATGDVERRRYRSSLGWDDGVFGVTVVAEMSRHKRHALILDAVARLGDSPVRVAFVGSGPLEDALMRRAQRLGIADRVTFLGRRDDVQMILRCSDALAHVSAREGLARSVLEAMATGLPIICCPARGVTDAVGPRQGWVVPPEPPAIAQAFREASSNPLESRSRGVAARERAICDFDYAIVEKAVLDLYDEAMRTHDHTRV